MEGGGRVRREGERAGGREEGREGEQWKERQGEGTERERENAETHTLYTVLLCQHIHPYRT